MNNTTSEYISGCCNFTNSSHAMRTADLDISHPGFLVYYLVLLLVEAVGLASVLLTITGLCCNINILSALAVFLVNQLLACAAVILILSVMLTNAVALVIMKAFTDDTGKASQPPLLLCQVYLWIYGFASVGRLWSLLAFSVVVLIIVKYGSKVFKLVHLVIGVAAVWIISFLVCIFLGLPYPVYAVHFVDGVGCFPHLTIIPEVIRYPIITIEWAILGGFLPLGVSIVILISTLHYIRSNTVSQDLRQVYNKKIVKFALFVVVGNIVNLVGQAVPGLIALQSEAIGLLLSYALVSISLLPTPLIVIACLKPVQVRVKTLVCCFWSWPDMSTAKQPGVICTSKPGSAAVT